MEGLKYKPANNQVEITHILACEELLQFSHKHGISVTACGPFGAPGQTYHHAKPEDAPNFLDHPVIVGIGNKYGKTPSQVILRWGIQRGYAVIPKSTNPARLVQNFDIFDFELREEDMKEMLTLDKGLRVNYEQFFTMERPPSFPF